MKAMPATVACYRSSPEFTEQTVPKALLRDHITAQGVWASIVVLDGALRYCITEPAPEAHLLQAGDAGVIEPRMKHCVELVGPVRFRVDFYR